MKPTPPRPRIHPRILFPVLAVALAPLLAPADASANDWYRWRGPEQNGVSREKNLPESWDPDTGENVAWKLDIGGMSSPVVMKGKVYTLNRINETKAEGTVTAGPQTQEALICTDAKTGKILWQHAENMYQTDVPFHRIGWSNAVPGLPLITAPSASNDDVKRLNRAITHALADPMLSGPRAYLKLAGYEILPESAYESVLSMERRAIDAGYPQLA